MIPILIMFLVRGQVGMCSVLIMFLSMMESGSEQVY